MKGLVKYPFHVKHKGKRYGTGEAVEVDDVESAVAQGAQPVQPASPGRPKQKSQ